MHRSFPLFKRFQPTIGLEVHSQLSCNTKLFSRSSTHSGAPLNTLLSFFDIALPGSLPILNKSCVEKAIQLALALNCTINPLSRFDRKHYFYYDMPLGFQITQQFQPIASNGTILVDGKQIRIKQIQLEQDSGKSLSDIEPGVNLVDCNRAGVGLVEIVTEPDFTSSEQVLEFLSELRFLQRHLNVCDGDMSKGSMRCDVNVSIAVDGVRGTRCELKNLNSFKKIREAIEFELERQEILLLEGRTIRQETREYKVNKKKTVAMRSKLEGNDYRFMPEPEMPVVVVGEEWLQELRKSLPELPRVQEERMMNSYKLNATEYAVLCKEEGGVVYFDEMCRHEYVPKAINWVVNELAGLVHQRFQTLSTCKVTPVQMRSLVDVVNEGKITGKAGKKIISRMVDGDKRNALEMALEMGWLEDLDETFDLNVFVVNLIEKHPERVKEIQSGRHRILGAFVGDVMKATKGKANPVQVASLLKEKLRI